LQEIESRPCAAPIIAEAMNELYERTHSPPFTATESPISGSRVRLFEARPGMTAFAVTY
jgi:hypothetical protein